MSVQVEIDIRAALEQLVESRRIFARMHGEVYVCMEDYVLQNGRGFTELCPRKYKLGQIKMCFLNARNLALRSHGYLTYVEGFAFATFIPVLHAWNMDPEGRLVDPTWARRTPVEPSRYYGVPFPDIKQVLAAHDASGSVIDDWQNCWPLLQSKESI